MSYLEIVFLAFALSVDACVVSFSYGLVINQERLKSALMLAVFTGVFQGAMPCLGYFSTNFIRPYISSHAQLIVFIIFTALGLKFILESFAENKEKTIDIKLLSLFLIGVATSVDAFSAGISLSLYGNRIFKPALLITAITFINSILGFNFGGKVKNIPTQWLEIFAGLVLIFLGVKSLF